MAFSSAQDKLSSGSYVGPSCGFCRSGRPWTGRLTVRRFFKAPQVSGCTGGVHQQNGPGGFGNPVGVQFAKRPFDYPVLDPTVETFIDYVPFAVFLRQPSPFAAVFAYVQRFYGGDVFNRYPAALDGQYAPDFFVCPLVYFHVSILASFVSFS